MLDMRWPDSLLGGSMLAVRRGFHTDLLAGLANGQVVLVGDDAHLIHEADLLLIVAIQRLRAGVDVGEETQHGLGRDGLRLGRGGGCRRHGDVRSNGGVFRGLVGHEGEFRSSEPGKGQEGVSDPGTAGLNLPLQD